MMTQEEIAKLHHEAEIELKKYPGVIGVGYGYKETQGKITDQLCFCIYVVEKKAKSDLLLEEVIPTEYKGLLTDVLTIPEGNNLHCEDLEAHSPLISGITISNLKSSGVPSEGFHFGTLGFFAYLNNVVGPENVVSVSNNHAFMARGAQVGDPIYQTKRVEQPDGTIVFAPPTKGTKIQIGNIHDAGLEGNHPYQYPGEPRKDFGIDCASAKLNISISSWCNTNCGVSYKNEVRGLNLNGSNRIADIDRVSQSSLTPGTDYFVFKVGKTTSRTKGRVLKSNATLRIGGVGGIIFKDMIEIEAIEDDCNNVRQFVDKGDSGSALLNSERKLVGLVKSSAILPDGRRMAYACHIHPVLDKLNIEVISEANPPVGPAGEALDDFPGIMTAGNVNHTPLLREKFLKTETGREIYDLVLTHRFEVSELVNHRRPVTVAWHRKKGPVFLSHLINNARDPAHPVPYEIEGVNRETLLRNMAQVLSVHGSTGLKVAIKQYLDEVLFYMNRFDNLHEVAERLEP